MAKKFPLRKRKRPDTKEAISAGVEVKTLKKGEGKKKLHSKMDSESKELEGETEVPILSAQFIKQWKSDLPSWED